MDNKIKCLCKNCGKVFYIRKTLWKYHNGKTGMFCSLQCFGKYKIRFKRINKICSHCHKEFTAPKCLDYRKYCSKKCYGMSRRGKNLPPKTMEQRKAISKRMMGNIPWNKGIPRTKEEIRKISNSKGELSRGTLESLTLNLQKIKLANLCMEDFAVKIVLYGKAAKYI